MPSNNSVKTSLELIKKDVSKILGITTGKHNIAEPGQYVPRADAQSQPELTFSGASPSKTYIVIELDIDAPFPSFPKLGPILHWVQPGFKLSSTGVLESTEPFIANYIGPAPPPVSSPHRYTFFLYEQPDGLDIKKFALPEYSSKPSVVTGRMWASLDDWEKKLGLGQVVAVNYYKSN